MKCMQRDTYGKKMGSIVMGCGEICQSEVRGFLRREALGEVDF